MLLFLCKSICVNCALLDSALFNAMVDISKSCAIFQQSAKHQQHNGRRATGALHQQFLAATLLAFGECRVVWVLSWKMPCCGGICRVVVVLLRSMLCRAVDTVVDADDGCDASVDKTGAMRPR
jgi:hypothetical protein